MSRTRVAALLVLASAAPARLAAAQWLPVPLPLPLPPPSFDPAPPSGTTEPPGPPAGPAAERAPAVSSTATGLPPFGAAMRVSSAADAEALRRSRVHETWYGWETLACDAAAVAVLLLGAAVDTGRPPTLDAAPDARPVAFEAVASGLYLAGPTTLHFARGNVWQGFASAGLRIALPLVGFALGSLVGSALPGRSDRASSDGSFGAVAGGAAAMVIDASTLGWQRWYGSERTASVPLLGARGSF